MGTIMERIIIKTKEEREKKGISIPFNPKPS